MSNQIEAVQWFKGMKNPLVEGVFKDPVTGAIIGQIKYPEQPTISAYAIKTMDGWREVKSGDWIIQGVLSGDSSGGSV